MDKDQKGSQGQRPSPPPKPPRGRTSSRGESSTDPSGSPPPRGRTSSRGESSTDPSGSPRPPTTQLRRGSAPTQSRGSPPLTQPRGSPPPTQPRGSLSPTQPRGSLSPTQPRGISQVTQLRGMPPLTRARGALVPPMTMTRSPTPYVAESVPKSGPAPGSRRDAPTRVQMAKRVTIAEPSKPSPVRISMTVDRPELTQSSRKASLEEQIEAIEKAEKPKKLFEKKKKPEPSQEVPSKSVFVRGPKYNQRDIRNVKQSHINYSTDEEVRDALMEFGVFLIFLLLTSTVALSTRQHYMYYFNKTIKELFTVRDMAVDTTSTISFQKILTANDWWDYLKFNFLVTLHGGTTIALDDGTPAEPATNSTDDGEGEKKDNDDNEEPNKNPDDDGKDNGNEGGEDSRRFRLNEDRLKRDGAYNDTYLSGRVFLRENLMLGPPRIRQIRVRKGSCYVNDAFIRYFNTCYAPYSKTSEETSTTYKSTKFRTMNDLEATPIWTLLSLYRSGGYVVDLTYEKEENNKKVEALKELGWVDRGARLCVIEFSMYNENTDIFQSVKLIAEIPPTGCIIPQTHLCCVKEYSFFTERSLFMMVCYIFWYVMIVYYTIFETNELRKTGFRIYYRSLLNVLDGIVLLFCYLAFVYNIWHTFHIQHLTTHNKINRGFLSIDYLCFWNDLYVDMMALLAFLVWIKIFKFISFNKTLVQFTTTLRRCYKDLAGFSLMFGIVFLAYAQLGLLLFGTKHPDFDTFTTSILTMVRMILGDFQYKLIEQANRVLGPIYFLTYILLMFFILLNMFLAIIMETYNSVKSEITTGRSNLGSYIYRKISIAFNWIFYSCRRHRHADHAALASVPETPIASGFRNPQRFDDTQPDIEERELFRLRNRVMRLEDILEGLVQNLDVIQDHINKGHFKRRRKLERKQNSCKVT